MTSDDWKGLKAIMGDNLHLASVPVRDSELDVMLRFAKRNHNGDVPRLVASLRAARAEIERLQNENAVLANRVESLANMYLESRT